MPPITLHVGFSRDIPFTVTLGGVVVNDPVSAASTQPTNMSVQLVEPRTLRVTGLNPSAIATALVRAAPGTPSEAAFPLEFNVLPAPPPVALVIFGEPGPEFPA